MSRATILVSGAFLAIAFVIGALSLGDVRPEARAQDGSVVVGPGGLPLIKAEPGPYKVKPQDPGGLKVPHKDKTIYERLEGPSRKVAPAADAGRGKKKPGEKAVAQAIGPYRVQLGSYTAPEIAERRWRDLQKRHADMLGPLQKFVERVEIRSKGTFYRLQAGPFKSPEEVQKFCAVMAKRKQGCILVKS